MTDDPAWLDHRMAYKAAEAWRRARRTAALRAAVAIVDSCEERILSLPARASPPPHGAWHTLETWRESGRARRDA